MRSRIWSQVFSKNLTLERLLHRNRLLLGDPELVVLELSVQQGSFVLFERPY